MPDATARDLGEVGLVARVTERLGTAPGVLLGPGDDAAVVAAADGRVVATTDVLVEDVHFRRAWSSGYDVGRKAAAQNLADVMAMGGTGTALLVSLVAPPDLPVDWALSLADGLRDEAAVVGAAVVGGDMATGERVVVAVTALGNLAGRAPVLRSGARPGDVVVLAGAVGASAAGLALLQQGRRDGPLVAAHLRPCPPYALGPVLAALGATAMVDVSDGLATDLGHVARASGASVGLHAGRLAAALPEGVTVEQALTGGEDHALAATVPPGTTLPDGVVPVGRVDAGPAQVLLDGEPVRGGWEHFR
ncbi:MAG TPA: thiamine-phosphate kinase [Mycobacteriales bacterium]|nr:thiamine-phosphate kinase [Mycobacteriales bacterium]